ncbi:MAG: AraC family transcriptional regulator [Chlorobi bacterium]|nr:AraC family transcriptional regulator [Chlorobiota bacterium]
MSDASNHILPVYREFPPSPPLAPYVECYWTMRAAGSSTPTPNRVLPDGCVDIIFDATEPASAFDPSRGTVIGVMRRPRVVMLGGPLELIAVRFRPGCGRIFFPVPMSELADYSIALSDLWRDGIRDVAMPLDDGATIARRLERFDMLLARRLGSAPVPDRSVAGALGLIGRSGGRIAISALEKSLGVSGRHLARRFNDQVGLAPKMLARIVRFQNAAALLRRGSAIDPHELVHHCGFHDQPHLIHEFRSLSGLTPTQFGREMAGRV